MKILLFLVAHAITGIAYAQSIEPLSVGDKLPDLMFPKVVQYKQPYFSTGEVEGTPLLLCSWNERCSVVRDFAVTLDSFQKAYAGKFQVLLVTPTPSNDIQKALSYYDELQGSSLPIAVGDSNFRWYFPHKAAPMLVWVGKTGRIEALTAHTLFNQKNFLSFIRGDALNLPTRQDVDDGVYKSLASLMDQNYGSRQGSLMAYTYMGGSMPHIKSSRGFYAADPITQQTQFKLMNTSVYGLYLSAYQRFEDFHPSLFFTEGKMQELRDSVYCYEQILKNVSRDEAFAKMKSSLDLFFGVESSLQKKKMKVYVLTVMKSNGRFVANASSKAQSYVKNGRHIRKAIRPKMLVRSWNLNKLFPYFVIDETGYGGKMDLELPADAVEPEALRKSLQAYDLNLSEAEREVNVIVVKARKE